MDKNTKVCTCCGAACDQNAVSCPRCSNGFPKESIADDPVLDGTDNLTAKKFIGQRANYYIKKFSRVKGKKTFLQLNFAALLFGQNWFFYRKMHKEAIILSAISILFSSILLLSMASIFEADTDRYFVDKKAYDDYVHSDVKMFICNDEGYIVENEEYDYSKRDNLRESQNKIKLIDFFRTFPVLLLNIFVRLLGNSFYKRNLISNIKSGNTSKIGTSPLYAVLGAVGVFIFGMIVTVMLLRIPVVSRYIEATNTLYNWL